MPVLVATTPRESAAERGDEVGDDLGAAAARGVDALGGRAGGEDVVDADEDGAQRGGDVDALAGVEAVLVGGDEGVGLALEAQVDADGRGGDLDGLVAQRAGLEDDGEVLDDLG